MPIYCRGIRGATTVETNSREAILECARALLLQIIEANDVRPEDVGSAIFTTTPDLNAEFPALAARELGWHDVALICGHEMSVPDSLDRCLRILIHWNTPKAQNEIVHVYTKGAKNLRPERSHSILGKAETSLKTEGVLS